MTKDKLVEGGEWEVDGTPTVGTPPAQAANVAGTTAGETPDKSSPSGSLDENADKVIREYFTAHAGNVFGGSHQDALSNTLISNLSNGLGRIAPRYLYAQPDRAMLLIAKEHVPMPTVRYSYKTEDKVEPLRELILALEGEEARGMDICSDEFLNEPEQVNQTWPEIVNFHDAMKCSYTLHRYLAVLSLPSRMRSLPALAMERREEEYLYIFKPEYTDLHVSEIRREIFNRFKSQCMPTPSGIIQIAKEYKTKEVGPVLKALKEVEDQYRAVWLQQ